MNRTAEQAARAEAIAIAAAFYAGRDGVGPDRLVKTAELVLAYIAHGEEHVLSARGRARRA